MERALLRESERISGVGLFIILYAKLIVDAFGKFLLKDVKIQ